MLHFLQQEAQCQRQHWVLQTCHSYILLTHETLDVSDTSSQVSIGNFRNARNIAVTLQCLSKNKMISPFLGGSVLLLPIFFVLLKKHQEH